jgi:steroid delta-isomerase-like uncharacterized protein
MAGKDLVQEQVEAFNRHDTAALAAGYATDVVVSDPFYQEPLTGWDAVEKDFAEFVRAFPDVQQTANSVMEQGDVVAAEFTVRGTHTGPLATPEGEIPATGREVELRGASFARLNADGKISEEHRYYDVAGLAAQLGITL